MIRTNFAGHRAPIHGSAWMMAGCLMAVAGPIALAGGRDAGTKAPAKDHYAGKELFVKVWEPGKRSPTGGDGLGPLYNETSCVACHRLGGMGGAGGNRENVKLLTADGGGGGQFEETGKTYIGELEDLHFGFRDGTTAVLHRHAASPSGAKRLEEIGSFKIVTTHDRKCTLRTSSRNTPALFGSGKIDEFPEEVLLAAQRRDFEEFPEIRGRVSRLPDGRIGRFGWKGQMATLREFVMAACANELGLEVPGRHQPGLEPPKDPNTSAVKLDLNQRQCDELVAFVAGLAPPRIRSIADDRASQPWGYSVFERIGCAACHTPRLGEINGIYSDLLLHDMGKGLGDIASSYGVPPSSNDVATRAADRDLARETRAPAVETEWRTPPLWGVADSAPYLHDGRARTLHQAITFHGGEAEATAGRYAKLSRGERIALFNFLHSLTTARGRRAAAIDAIQARSHRMDAADPRE